jgi:hypothetical protein
MSSDSRQFDPFGAGSSAAVSGDLHAPGIATDELTVTGTNGTLVIQDIRFIVEELELRSSNGLNGCDDDDDNDGDDDAARTPALLAEMRAVYPNFPSRASLVVKGTQNGQPFTVFFRAKLRASQAIVPPFTIPGDYELTVKIDPGMWFKNGNQVFDLLSLHGRLIELDDRFEGGISGTHSGRH